MLRRNVLIFHAGGLGDFVLTWPLMVAMGRLHPQSRIYAITHASKGQLARRALGIEAADIESGWPALHGGADPGERAMKLLGGAHTIVNLLAGPDDAFPRHLAMASGGASVVTIRPTAPVGWRRHITEYHLEQLENWPAIQTALGQILRSAAERGLGAARRPGAGFLIHPGSGGVAKCWPIERYIELATALKSDGPVEFVVGEVEMERWTAADLGRLESVAPLTRCPTPMALLSRIQSRGVFIGNDSGPTHLAAILATPTVALFGPTDPAVWAPLGPHVTVMRCEPLATLEAMAVAATAAKLLPSEAVAPGVEAEE